MQLGFFIQQSASKGEPGVRFMHIRQLNRGARWRTPHMLSYSLIQTIGSSEIYFRFFFHRGTCISDVHTGAYPISVLWNKTDDFS